MLKIPASEITPEHIYLNRRQFLKGGALAAASAVLAACAPKPTALPADGTPPSASRTTDELGDSLTPYETITHYNNYYEFSQDKAQVAGMVGKFPTSPWNVQVGGLVKNAKTYGIEDLLKKFDQAEHIYRHRCVEGWSFVAPWTGFPLAKLLAEVEPTSDAKFVRFETVYAPDQMPGQNDGWFDWPYVEGLRLDEAMNDLPLLVTGLYGKPLPTQDGAPLRLAVPWKYGFKSVKAIVKIDLVAEMPTSLWMAANGHEYGFYANVNPTVDHPRWSQATERRLGELGRRKTLTFNGYSDEVAHLYAGMDLRVNY
jgi:sulfoxide reductase catalytic subunit YedY